MKKFSKISAVVLIVSLAVLMCGCGKTSMDSQIGSNNIMDKEETNPLPFSSAKWGMTENELKELLGEPEKDADNPIYGHALVYKETELEGYKGHPYYYFQDGKLTRVFFMIDQYDEKLTNHFFALFEEKYGEPAYSDNQGNKRWETKTAMYTVMGAQSFGGFTNIVYMDPGLQAE